MRVWSAMAKKIATELETRGTKHGGSKNRGGDIEKDHSLAEGYTCPRDVRRRTAGPYPSAPSGVPDATIA